MSTIISTCQSANNQGELVKGLASRSYVASSKSWKWLKQSLCQGSLVATICALAGRSLFLWPSYPVIALGCGFTACAIVFLNKKKISQMRSDFKGLNGTTKLLAMGIPLIIGVTAPALIGYSLNLSLNECFIAIPLITLSAGLPFFKAKDDAIDCIFLRNSRIYSFVESKARTNGILVDLALYELQQPRTRNTENGSSQRKPAGPLQSTMIKEVTTESLEPHQLISESPIIEEVI